MTIDDKWALILKEVAGVASAEPEVQAVMQHIFALGADFTHAAIAEFDLGEANVTKFWAELPAFASHIMWLGRDIARFYTPLAFEAKRT